MLKLGGNCVFTITIYNYYIIMISVEPILKNEKRNGWCVRALEMNGNEWGKGRESVCVWCMVQRTMYSFLDKYICKPKRRHTYRRLLRANNNVRDIKVQRYLHLVLRLVHNAGCFQSLLLLVVLLLFFFVVLLYPWSGSNCIVWVFKVDTSGLPRMAANEIMLF